MAATSTNPILRHVPLSRRLRQPLRGLRATTDPTAASAGVRYGETGTTYFRENTPKFGAGNDVSFDKIRHAFHALSRERDGPTFGAWVGRGERPPGERPPGERPRPGARATVHALRPTTS